LSELVEKLAAHLCDTFYGAGTWANPGTLPDELDRDKWRIIALAALAFLDEPNPSIQGSE
jgi:hypothetical protein